MIKSTVENFWLTPAQMAGRTGVAIDTLCYYEREGLLQPVERNSSKHCRYIRTVMNAEAFNLFSIAEVLY